MPTDEMTAPALVLILGLVIARILHIIIWGWPVRGRPKIDEINIDPPPRGYITPFMQCVATFFSLPSRLFFPSRNEAQKIDPRDKAYHEWRGNQVDLYLMVWCVIEAIAAVTVIKLNGSQRMFCALLCVLLGIRAPGIIAAMFEIALGGKTFVLSRGRMVALVIINYLELLVCFGVFYTFWSRFISGPEKGGVLDGMHLSAVSQLTIGYGDLYPTEGLRIVTWFQGLCSMLLVALAFGRYVSSLEPLPELAEEAERLQKRRQDELKGREI